ACIGREFDYRLLSLISPVTGHKLDEALRHLMDAGLVFQRGTPPESSYTFKHALVQDAAYDSLLKSKRSQLHAQIADLLEKHFAQLVNDQPELLAYHLTQAGLHARAIAHWMRAGERAMARVALPEAVGHLTK